MVGVNRVVGATPFPSSKVEVWHASDEGDLREFVFELPQTVRCRSGPKARLNKLSVPCNACPQCFLVGNAIRDYGRRWIDKLAKENLLVNPKSIRVRGPYPCLTLDKLDMDSYVISLRVRQTKPRYLPLEQAEAIVNTEPSYGSIADIYAQGQRAPELIEDNARQRAESDAAMPQVRASWEQMDRERAEHGLPPFKGD